MPPAINERLNTHFTGGMHPFLFYSLFICYCFHESVTRYFCIESTKIIQSVWSYLLTKHSIYCHISYKPRHAISTVSTISIYSIYYLYLLYLLSLSTLSTISIYSIYYLYLLYLLSLSTLSTPAFIYVTFHD